MKMKRQVLILLAFTALVAVSNGMPMNIGLEFKCDGNQWEPLAPSYATYCSDLCGWCKEHQPKDPFSCMDEQFCRIAFDCSKYVAKESSQAAVMDPWCQKEACGYCKWDASPAVCMMTNYQSYCAEKTEIPPVVASTAAPPRPPTLPQVNTDKNPGTGSNNNKPDEVSGGGCYAPNKWYAAECVLCPNPSGSACASFSYTKCYKTLKECKEDPVVGSNAASAGCKENCAANTLKMKRPSFKGPNCYNNKFGSQFGPQWVPSGKTNFEKYVKSPTDFFKAVSTVERSPALPASWNLENCDAATAVFENVVCAIELLEATGKVFEGPGGRSGARISEFAGNGDPQVDRREIAAFFAHKFKEVARLTVWEEAGDSAKYIDTNQPYFEGQTYHGRGPVQLSWNYNYRDFSQWFYGDSNVLLRDATQVDPEGPMGFIAAFWFWFTPRDFTSGAPVAGKIRTRDAIVHWTDGKMNSLYGDGKDYDSVAGFSLSTNVINGGIECASDNGGAAWRVGYFLTAASRMGVTLPPHLDNPIACMSDKFCKGLFAGCSAVASGLRCEGKDTACGLAFSEGWGTNMCRK